jgi:putative transposase
MPRPGGLRIERMCQLAQVSRAGFYRSLQEAQPVEDALLVRAEIQEIVLGASAPVRVSADYGRAGAAGPAG